MSFSLWPRSATDEHSRRATAGDGSRIYTPALDFMQILHSSGLEISDYVTFAGNTSLDTSKIVGSGTQAIIESSARPGVVVKRTRRLQDGRGKYISRSDKDLEHLALELRILTSKSFRRLNLFVTVVGICYEEPFAGLDSSDIGHFHLLLEHSKLGDMATFLRQHNEEVDSEARLDLAFQVSRGLLILHEEAIAHGDLKIQNVLLFRDDGDHYIAKIADFGLSVHAHYGHYSEGSQTNVYCPLGTPLLSAPEVRNGALRGELVDITAVMKTDIFSFGLLLWEILNDGHSFFNLAWLDRTEGSAGESNVEDKMAFLLKLPCNQLLQSGKNFLLSQTFSQKTREKAMNVFQACLQDDPAERKHIRSVWRILLPEGQLPNLNMDHIENLASVGRQTRQGFQTWITQFPRREFLDFTCLNLPDSLQRRALDELKMYASAPQPFEFFDNVRMEAALDVARCHLIAFGTKYDFNEALHWLLMSKSYGALSYISSRRFSEVLKMKNSALVASFECKPDASRERKLETSAASESFMVARLQRKIHAACQGIRSLGSKGQLWVTVGYIGLHATTMVSLKISDDIVGPQDMTHLQIAAFLQDNEILKQLLSEEDVLVEPGAMANVLYSACLGGNLPALEFLLEIGADVELPGKNGITVLHLMICMPPELVKKAVSLLIKHGASTEAHSEGARLAKTTLTLAGTPIEWAVITRHRGLVAALLPHSRGQERKLLGHAISYAYYEIVEDILSDSASSATYSSVDCPLLNFPRPLTHLFVHGHDGDDAIERTIRLCHTHNLIDYNSMLRRCLRFARSQACLKALEILLLLCPGTIIRQGFQSDDVDEVLASSLYLALERARANVAWRPILETMLREFTVTELEGGRVLRDSRTGDFHKYGNVLFTAVIAGWAVGAQVLLDKGVSSCQKFNEHTTLSITDVAAHTGNAEIQAILSEHEKVKAGALQNIMTREPSSWLLTMKKQMTREKFAALIDQRDIHMHSRIPVVVWEAHEILEKVLVSRDRYFTPPSMNSGMLQFKIQLWELLRTLISHESMVGYIDAPDSHGVTMLQRATSFVDIEVVRLLLAAGANADLPFVASTRAANDRLNLEVPFIPFKIAIWVSTATASLFSRGHIRTSETVNFESSKQTALAKTTQPRFLRRVARTVAHASETGAKHLQALAGHSDLTPGEKTAEMLRHDALGVAQELLQWHLMRNDGRFEGITEVHIAALMGYVSHATRFGRQDPKVWNAKASWPGLEGKYTAIDLTKVSKVDEWSVFPAEFKKLRRYHKSPV